MISWLNYIKTINGYMTTKQILVDAYDWDLSKLKRRIYRSELDISEDLITESPKSYWIHPKSEIIVYNEYNKPTPIKRIYIEDISYNALKVHFFAEVDPKNRGSSSRHIIKCTPSQRVLTATGEWKYVKDLVLAKDYARIYHDLANFGIYYGTLWTSKSHTMITIEVEDGIGFQCKPGIVLLSG